MVYRNATQRSTFVGDPMKNHQIVVIGSGPAALSVAVSLVETGVSVSIVAPDPFAAWVPNYGGWADQFPDDFAKNYFQQTYAAPCVRLSGSGGASERVLRGRYARIHKTKLQESYLSTLKEHAVSFFDTKVSTIESEGKKDHLQLESGQVLTADLVIDASGANSSFVQKQGKGKEAYQLAYGQTIQTKPHGFRCGEMRFMDFTPLQDNENIATFLYAMPLSHDTLFVEETVLATRQQVSFDFLKARLEMRLEQEGIDVTGVLDEEFCKIPLGLPLPKGQQRVIPFGAAASMVHPASGYLFSRVIATAPEIAKHIAANLGQQPKAELLKAGLNIIWPSSRRRTRELYMIGLEMLTRMDPKRNRDFFNAFFELPLESWRGFLDDTLTPYELGLTMSKMFALSKTGLRFSLVHNTVSHASEHLFKAVSPSFTRKERC
tara:strand:- start:12465 stop:13766 length:1302 start_codon:yes stop_codon:yes gene_type:complete